MSKPPIPNVSGRRRAGLAAPYWLPLLLLSVLAWTLSVACRAGESVQPATPYVSESVLEERFGIRIRLLAVTAGGGLVDFRFKVTDPVKAAELVARPENAPRLVAVESGAELSAPADALKDARIEMDRTYYILYPNVRDAIRPGMRVSVAVGDLRIEPMIAQ